MMRCRSILFLLLVWPLWLHGTEEPLHQTAINDALQSGRALWKVISPSDAGRTGKLQPSLYFPKQAWQFFSAEPPPKEENRRETLEIIWPDHSRAGALITWYGKGNKNACRPTHPGDQISPQSVGDLFVLMPAGDKTFHGYLLGTDEAAEAFCQDLGMEPGQRWGSYGEISGAKSSQDTLESWAAREAVRHSDFPTGKVMAGLARQAVQDCQPETGRQSADLRLMAWLDAEYAIYRAIERKLSAGVLRQDFATVEEFPRRA
jgi:type II restriction enzyme